MPWRPNASRRAPLASTSEPSHRHSPLGRRGLLLVALLVLALPLAVAVVALNSPRWYPGLELAQTELHVRDVGTRHTPLTGLVGRLGAPGERGSHPGPLSFVALAPVYRLAGSSPWGLQVSTVVLHLSAIGAASAIAARRGGMRLLLLTAAGLTVLARFYGASLLTEPWNPYLPMLWWLVFVLAVWSVVEDDLALLPVAVVAGSFCAQTHIAYVGLVAGLGGCTMATVLVRELRRRTRSSGPAPGPTWAWLVPSAVIGAVLWLPPVVDELKRDPGNLSVLVDYFTSSTEDPIGLRRGIELLLANLNPWRLLFGHAQAKVVADPPPWSVVSLLFLAAWIASIVVAWRSKLRSTLRLDAVIVIALGFGALSASRIYGPSWAWLVQWAWGLTALMAVAIAWTFWCVVQQGLKGSRRLRSVRIGAISVLAVISVGSTVGSIEDAAHVEPDDVANSRALRHLVPATMEAVDGRADRYLITWTDPSGYIGGAQAFGLANELDRGGIAVGIEPNSRLRAAPYLTIDPSQTPVITLRLVTGAAIAEWESKPGTRRIAMYDPRTSDQRALQERLRGEIDDDLRALGRPELISLVDGSFLAAVLVFDKDPRIPEDLIAKMVRVVTLGSASAVFLEE